MGFNIGGKNLSILYNTGQMSHIINMDKLKKSEEDDNDDEDTQELIDGFEQIEKPKDMKHRKSSVLEESNEAGTNSNPSKMEETQPPIAQSTPNETDIAEMVRTENSKEFSAIIHDEKQSKEESEIPNAESPSSSDFD